MKKLLIEQLEYLEGNLADRAVVNYNSIVEVMNSADPYYYSRIERMLYEMFPVIHDINLHYELEENTGSLEEMIRFIGDTRPDDIYLLHNENLKNITNRDFEILIHDLISEIDLV